MTNHEIIESLKKSKNGTHICDIVAWEFPTRVDRALVEAATQRHLLEKLLKMPTLTPINAYKRAVIAVTKGQSVEKREWIVSKVETNENHIVHQYHERSVVESDETGVAHHAADYAHSIATRFCRDKYKAGDDWRNLIQTTDASHPITAAVISAYMEIMGTYHAGDLRNMSSRVFSRIGGFPLKTAMGVFMVPATQATIVRRWADWCTDIGASSLILPQFDAPETRTVMTRTATDGVEAALEQFMADLNTFAEKGDVRVSTLEKRVEELDRLRDNAAVYESLLDISMRELKKGIDKAEKQFLAQIASLAK